MKFTPVFAKIAASLMILLVSAKAANGQQCLDGSDVPAPIVALGSSLVGTYCRVYNSDPAQAKIFVAVVGKSLEIDPTGTFLGTCLQDLLEGAQYSAIENVYRQKAFDDIKALGDCYEGDGRNGSFVSRLVCPDDKTKVATYSDLTVTSLDGNVFDTSSWDDLLMCKSASCNADVLNQVLSETYDDFFPGQCEPSIVTATYTPNVECLYDQIRAPIEDPELYCSGDNAPVCKNTKLVEITLLDDAPFEVAICDDNDCLASVGSADIARFFATGYGIGENNKRNNPYCLPDQSTKHFQTRYREQVSAKYSDKVFNLTDYCSVAAASTRTGQCKTSKAAKSKKCKKKTKKSKNKIKKPKKNKKNKKSKNKKNKNKKNKKSKKNSD